MNSYRNDPDGEANQTATKQINREIFALRQIHNQLNQTMYTFDIETIALPDHQLVDLMPTFEAPSNYKDPEKIKANIDDQARRWKEQAALSPLTGRVAIVGVLDSKGTFDIWDFTQDEKEQLWSFWTFLRQENSRYMGWNIKGFDVPFLVQRSWINGITVPMEFLFDGRYLQRDRFIDLQEVWACYGPSRTGMSLSAVSQACGVGVKTASGADFGKLWETDKEAAIKYCQYDCELAFALARRMGVHP